MSEKPAKRPFSVDSNNNNGEKQCYLLIFSMTNLKLAVYYFYVNLFQFYYVRRCNCRGLPRGFGINWNPHSCLVEQQISN